MDYRHLAHDSFIELFISDSLRHSSGSAARTVMSCGTVIVVYYLKFNFKNISYLGHKPFQQPHLLLEQRLRFMSLGEPDNHQDVIFLFPWNFRV